MVSAGALAAYQLICSPLLGVLGVCVLGATIGPLLPWRRARSELCMLFGMVSGGVLGWLLGLYAELGPVGLTIIDSWCSTFSGSAVELTQAKVVLLPWAHGSMLSGCLLAMLWFSHSYSRRQRLLCCLLMLLVMPLGVWLADLFSIMTRVSTDDSGGVLMLTTMVGAMLLCALVPMLSLRWRPALRVVC